MKKIFREMPRAIKVIFILYIVFFIQTILNITSTKFDQIPYLGFNLPYSLVQLLGIFILSINIFTILKKLKWGFKFIIISETVNLINALLLAWKYYSISTTEPVKLIWLGTGLFITLFSGLIIFYILRNQKYFKN